MSTFVFIHGAAHGAWCWAPVIEHLEAPAFCIDLPGRGKRLADLASLEITDYATSAIADIEKLDLEEIVLVGHSMAGVTLPRVADRLHERIKQLVFVSCAVPPHGENMLQLLDPIPSDPAEIASLVETMAQMPEDMARYMFCNDMNEAQAQFVIDNITPESPRLLLGPADLAGLRHAVPRSYLRLAQDQALPLSAQDKAIASLGDVDVIDLDTGHNIMVSNPRLLAGILNGYL